jgi:hypothetical protein
VAETTLERLICCWFWRTGKAMEQVLVDDMSRHKCFFQVRLSHFMFYIHLWPIYWFSLILLFFYDWGSRADISTALLNNGHKGGLSHPLVNPEKICILPLDFKHEWIKNFVKLISKDSMVSSTWNKNFLLTEKQK